MAAGMFFHEGFLVLYAPTILAGILFVYFLENREKRVLVTLVLSIITLVISFAVLMKFGNPPVGYEEFSRMIQARADFTITELSMRECFFSTRDHFNLASPYLTDAGAMANMCMALLILSPAIIILLNLWSHAFRSSGPHRKACFLFALATLSGLLLIPLATDYGRWFSAIIFCNFFAIFLLIGKGVIAVEELEEYSGGSFPYLFVLIVLTYLLFGPLHDWNPYPYMQNPIVSALSVGAVLLFDIGFCMRWRSLRRTSSRQ